MQIAITVLYFTVILGISLYISKKNDNINDFLVASGKLGAISLIPMLFSELIAGSGTIGNAAEAYNIGLASVWLNWGTALGCFLTVIFVSKFYRVMSYKGKMSVAESIAEYFDERTRIVMVFVTSVVYLIIFSLQPSAAAGILSPMLNIKPDVIIWIVGILFIILAATGGIEGMAKVNFLHSIVMFLGLGIACVASIKYAGGFENIYNNLPKETFNIFSPGIFTVFAWAIGTAINVPAGSMVASVVFGAKSLKTARKSLTYSGLVIIPFAIMVSMIGISAKASGLLIQQNDAIYTITAAISPILAGIASMAILAAILSTAPMMLMLTAGTITRDLYKGYLKKDATSKEQLVITKILVIVLGLAGIFMGLNIKSLLNQLLGAMQIRSIAGLVLMIGLTWKRVDNRAAFWSMLTGGLIAALWFFMGSPFGIEPLWPSSAVSLVILIVLTLTSKEKVYSGYIKYKEDEARLLGEKDIDSSSDSEMTGIPV